MGGKFVLEFEVISDEQRAMIRAVGRALSEFRKRSNAGAGEAAPSPAELFRDLLGGELAPHLPLLFAPADSGLPIRTDALRLLALHSLGGADPAQGGGRPKTLYTSSPARYGRARWDSPPFLRARAECS